MKTILIYILVAIVAIMGYQLYRAHRIDKDSKSVNLPKTGVSMQAEEIARKVDEQGAEHVIYKEAEPILKLIEVKVEDKTKVDSLLNLAGVKDKQLKSLSTVVANVQQENIQLKRIINNVTQDTVYAYKDKYLDLSFKRQSDTVTFGSFSYNFDFNSVQYWKRDWFLGAKKSYVDIWSSDPRVKIRGVDRLQIKQVMPEFGLRVQGNAQLNPETGAFGYGPALRIDANRFSFQGTYTYYPQSGRWRPTISGNFDFWRF